MSAAGILRDGFAILATLEGRPSALPAARIARLTGVPVRRVRRILAALVAIGRVGRTRDLLDADGRLRGWRFYIPRTVDTHSECRSEVSAAR